MEQPVGGLGGAGGVWPPSVVVSQRIHFLDGCQHKHGASERRGAARWWCGATRRHVGAQQASSLAGAAAAAAVVAKATATLSEGPSSSKHSSAVENFQIPLSGGSS